MSRTRICCVCLAALIGQATLVVVCEPAVGTARADQPKGNADQPNNRRPRPRNAQAPKKEAKPPADANLLSMELKALRILRGLEATPDQISAIARAAKTTAGSPGQRESAKVTGPYLEAMVQVRCALVAKDDDKIEALRTQFDQLEEKDRPDLDDQVEITDGAEIEGVRLLSIFGPLQIVAYAQSLEDDFPDPVQLIVEGLAEGREPRTRSGKEPEVGLPRKWVGLSAACKATRHRKSRNGSRPFSTKSTARRARPAIGSRKSASSWGPRDRW